MKPPNATPTTSTIANISPGEPFHTLEAGIDWLVNWYLVRTRSRMLIGPPADAIIEPIAPAEFIAIIRRHTANWAQWIEASRQLPPQSYAVLTLCRAAYTLTYGVQASKVQAATWAMQTFPAWASRIQRALAWRRGEAQAGVDPAATFPETVRFVKFIIEWTSNGQSPQIDDDLRIS